jgi:hypothetical protein
MTIGPRGMPQFGLRRILPGTCLDNYDRNESLQQLKNKMQLKQETE